MRTSALSVLSLFLVIGCATEPAELAPETEAAATARTIVDGSNDAVIVLYLANRLDRDTLDFEVTLDSRAAANIVAYRAGADGVEGTTDDQAFDDLDELDAVSFVGASAMADLLGYGRDVIGLTGEDVHGVLVNSIEADAVLFAANRLSETVLDYDVALDSRAAANIVDVRPSGGFATLTDLDAVPYVSSRAFGKLLAFADTRGMLDDEGLVVRAGVPYDTLQDAVDATSTSITIHLFAGTYTGTTEIEDTLVVRGYGKARTVFDGLGTDPLLVVTAGSPCFYDLTLRDGAGGYGAAADVTTTGFVLFDDVDFIDNVSSYSGGALYAGSGSDVVVRDARFEGNDSGAFGGGVYSLGELSVVRATFEHNTAYGAAALYAYDTVSVKDTAVRFNSETSTYQGAVTLRGEDITVDNLDFYDNTPGDLALDFGTGWDGLGSDISFTCTAAGCTGPL
jgi:predicted outer membrane repeat protein